MRCGRILIFLCQALYFTRRIQAEEGDKCVLLVTVLDELINVLKPFGDAVDALFLDNVHRIPSSLLNRTETITQILFGDGLSMAELYYYEKGENWTSNPVPQGNEVGNQLPNCQNNRSALYKEQLTKAIEKILQFYSMHEDVVLKQPGDLIGLSILKGVEDKHGKRFHRAYNISTWLTRTCKQVDKKMKDFCIKSTQLWNLDGGNHWKSKDILDSIVNSSDAEIGHEKEYNVRALSAPCQQAVITRCQVPHVCEKTLYDPTPRSQYYLAKQILQRIFTEQSDCPEAKRLLSEKVNDQLCSKMYQEAQLISEMGYPHIHRDLFVEYVAICGFLRYSNFFRQDWIERILSWQSESDYGCLVHDKGYKQNFWSFDAQFARRSSPEEKEKGLVPDEMCLPHSTMFALAAYSLTWDYMEDNCN